MCYNCFDNYYGEQDSRINPIILEHINDNKKMKASYLVRNTDRGRFLRGKLSIKKSKHVIKLIDGKDKELEKLEYKFKADPSTEDKPHWGYVAYDGVGKDANIYELWCDCQDFAYRLHYPMARKGIATFDLEKPYKGREASRGFGKHNELPAKDAQSQPKANPTNKAYLCKHLIHAVWFLILGKTESEVEDLRKKRAQEKKDAEFLTAKKKVKEVIPPKEKPEVPEPEEKPIKEPVEEPTKEPEKKVAPVKPIPKKLEPEPEEKEPEEENPTKPSTTKIKPVPKPVVTKPVPAAKPVKKELPVKPEPVTKVAPPVVRGKAIPATKDLTPKKLSDFKAQEAKKKADAEAVKKAEKEEKQKKSFSSYADEQKKKKEADEVKPEVKPEVKKPPVTTPATPVPTKAEVKPEVKKPVAPVPKPVGNPVAVPKQVAPVVRGKAVPATPNLNKEKLSDFIAKEKQKKELDKNKLK